MARKLAWFCCISPISETPVAVRVPGAELVVPGLLGVARRRAATAKPNTANERETWRRTHLIPSCAVRGHPAKSSWRPYRDYSKRSQPTLPSRRYNSGWTPSPLVPPRTTTACCGTTRRWSRSSKRGSSSACAQARLTFGGRVLCAVPRPELRRRRRLRADPRRLPRDLPRHREGREAPRPTSCGTAWTSPPRSASSADRSRATAVRSPTSRLDSFITTDAYQLRRAERGDARRDRLQRGAGRHLPGAAGGEEVPGALDTLRRFQARERLLETLARLPPRGGGPERAAHHRDRGLRGGAHPHRAPPLPRVLRGAAAIRRSCATRAT